MAHSPLSQFELTPLISLNFKNIDLSFTNSSLYMVLTIFISFIVFLLPMHKAKLIATGIQNIPEIIYQFIHNMIEENVGSQGTKYLPLIFSLFSFILFCNLLGMLPYSFTVTSHISVNFTLALFIFITVTVIAIKEQGLKFFSFFLPSGTPLWLAPLMIVIEFFTYIVRPVSLSIRLTANMVAGHILLKVLAGFVVVMGIWGFIPMSFVVISIGFEIFVAILQAYIFTMFTCIYLNDAINLH